MTKDQKLVKIKRGFYLIRKLESVLVDLEILTDFEDEIMTLHKGLSTEKENL